MPEPSEKQREGIDSAIYSGRKFEAIKLFREVVTGSELVDAKKWVEAREVELRSQRPEKFTASPGKACCIGMLAAIKLVLAVISNLIIAVLRA